MLACGAALAQRFELSALGAYPRFSSAPLGSISQTGGKDNDSKLKGQYGYGARFAWNTRGYYGHEIGYTQGRARFTTTLRTTVAKTTVTTSKEDRVTTQLASYNFLMYFMPRGERWRPYMTGGAQIQQYGAPRMEEFPHGRSRNYGVNYGGGFKIRLFPRTFVRLDVRDYLGGKPYDLTFEDPMRSGGIFRQLEASFGISIAF